MTVELQVWAAPPSSEHQAWAVPSLTVNDADAVELADVLGGVVVNVTTGAVLSIVKRDVRGRADVAGRVDARRG